MEFCMHVVDEAEFCMHVVDEEDVFKEDLKVSLEIGYFRSAVTNGSQDVQDL